MTLASLATPLERDSFSMVPTKLAGFGILHSNPWTNHHGLAYTMNQEVGSVSPKPHEKKLSKENGLTGCYQRRKKECWTVKLTACDYTEVVTLQCQGGN